MQASRSRKRRLGFKCWGFLGGTKHAALSPTNDTFLFSRNIFIICLSVVSAGHVITKCLTVLIAFLENWHNGRICGALFSIKYLCVTTCVSTSQSIDHYFFSPRNSPPLIPLSYLFCYFQHLLNSLLPFTVPLSLYDLLDHRIKILIIHGYILFRPRSNRHRCFVGVLVPFNSCMA